MKITTKNSKGHYGQLIQMVEWEIFTMSRMNKGWISRIYKEFLYINKNKTSARIENMNRKFTKEGIQKANKHMKRCLIISKSEYAS